MKKLIIILLVATNLVTGYYLLQTKQQDDKPLYMTAIPKECMTVIEKDSYIRENYKSDILTDNDKKVLNGQDDQYNKAVVSCQKNAIIE